MWDRFAILARPGNFVLDEGTGRWHSSESRWKTNFCERSLHCSRQRGKGDRNERNGYRRRKETIRIGGSATNNLWRKSFRSPSPSPRSTLDSNAVTRGSCFQSFPAMCFSFASLCDENDREREIGETFRCGFVLLLGLVLPSSCKKKNRLLSREAIRFDKVYPDELGIWILWRRQLLRYTVLHALLRETRKSVICILAP